MVLLDEHDEVVRPALLWNDTRSAQAARRARRRSWARRPGPTPTGLVPVAATTVSKLRWVAHHEPDSLARARTCVLPHDWLTGRILAPSGRWRVGRPGPRAGYLDHRRW